MKRIHTENDGSAPKADIADTPPRGLEAFRVEGGMEDHEEIVVLAFSLSEIVVPSNLSPAESMVARLVAEGLSNIEIADQRGCSRHTVANQVASILKKLQVSSRAELISLLAK